MSNFRSTRYARLKQARRREGIAAYYRHKADAARIPENENVLRTRVSADVVVTIKFKGQPQMPWGGWTISPTLAGQKVQQMMLHATT
jgi:hypothetical protein